MEKLRVMVKIVMTAEAVLFMMGVSGLIVLLSRLLGLS